MRVRPKSNKENKNNLILVFDYIHRLEDLVVSVFDHHTCYYWIYNKEIKPEDIGCWRIKELKKMGKTGV